MSTQCSFLTKNEREIVEFLKDGPKQRKEIIDQFGIKRKTTTERLLKRLEAKQDIFRVKIYDNVFYRINNFPRKILLFFALAEEMNNPQLYEVKETVLKQYPNSSFESIVKKQRTFLELTRPELKGIIKLLRDFEGKMYDIPPECV